ncbi:MAG: hypothetical protein OEM97_09790 [Acidimicrobiia bacterium]|nr:hypothetical protein [Acidimicrobiia bacterium]
MSEYLAAAAQKLGAPEELVERSARARAAAQGVDPDAILAAWAGGEAAPAPAAPPPAEAASAADPVLETSDEATDAPEPVTPALAPASAMAPAPAMVAPLPGPDRVSEAEAADFDVVTTVATSGLKERTFGALPTWLTVLLVVLPLAGLTYLVTFSGGPECGSSGQLAVDRIGGSVVGCDGSLFGGGAFAGGANPRDIVAMGQNIYSRCAGCHGGDGGGGAGFPVLSGGAVVSTFSSCADHLEWVSLGTAGFQAAGLATYGDAGKPVGGGGQMPAFGSLSEEDLRAVVFFERVSFGGEDPGAALENCGYVEPADGGTTDSTTAEGETTETTSADGDTAETAPADAGTEDTAPGDSGSGDGA